MARNLNLIPQGEAVVIHEHKRFPDSHWKATAQLEYVPGDDFSLRGDMYCATIRFSWGTEEPKLEYFLTCGDPDIWEEEIVNESLGKLQDWARKVCELLDRPPNLWPIGD